MDKCQATYNGMQCELPVDHVRERRRVAHNFMGRVGRCHICGVLRKGSASVDCAPYPPVSHRVAIHW